MNFQLKVREMLADSTIIHVEGEIDIGTVNQLLDPHAAQAAPADDENSTIAI